MEKLKRRLPFLFGDQYHSQVVRQVLSIVAATFVSQVLLQWFQNDLNFGLVINFIFLWHTEKFFLSWLVLMVAALWLWALTNHAKLVNMLMIGSATIFGYVTFEKMNQRQEPLYPADLKMLFEWDALVQLVSPWIVALVFALLLATLLLVFYLLRKEHVKIGWPARLVLFIVTSVGLGYIGQFQEQGNLLKRAYDRTAKWVPYSQKMNYYNTGFVAGFLYNLPSNPMAMPEGFDDQALETFFGKYSKVADEINATRAHEQIETNVIYIMNESFADPLALNRAKDDFDPIPFTRSFLQEARSGSMLSQGYGGGTANIEFEALTGFSMEPFAVNISTPFTQFLPKMTAFPSIVTRLKEAGLHPFAVHPFNTSMYKRRDNYQMLGFEEFYYDKTMAYKGKVGTHPYISDASAYREVLMRMQESHGYDFAHLVTMQNHTPFRSKYRTEPTYEQTGFVRKEINQYHRDLMESDKALEQLVSAIKTWEEPVIVVFWGDHWPSVFGEALKNQTGDIMSRTPVLVFSNKQLAPKKWDIISPIYFMSELWAAADTKVTPFDAFLMTMHEEIPALEKGSYYLVDGSLVTTRKQLPEKARAILKEYDWVMYDTTTGSKRLEEMGFFEVQ